MQSIFQTPTQVIVIGASAGGIDALRIIIGALPADFAPAIFVVLHTAADSPGILASILQRAGRLPAVSVTTRDSIRPGTIYVAAPDRHLLVDAHRALATRGPKENRFRPAVDPLFRSAAQAFGRGAVGVVLSGGLDDGSAGLLAIKRQGGIAIVQDPDTALNPSMPQNAMRAVEVDHCVPVEAIAPLLVRLAAEALPSSAERSDMSDRTTSAANREAAERLRIELDIARERDAIDAGVLQLGVPSNYACPDCHGVLLKLKEEGRIRFRCHTGHAYTLDSLLDDMNTRIDEALWNAIRALDERTLLLRSFGEHLRGEGHDKTAADEAVRQAENSERQAGFVRKAARDDTAALATETITASR